MNLKTRRIIMFSFIITFIVVAPMLIFYASGYRYDFKRFKIIKTGTLMLEAKDIKKADIYMDDKLYEEPLDEKIFIYNLLPREYDIIIKKEGYHDWQKKVTIKSSITTFVKDIILFKKEVPLLLNEGQIEEFALSPDWQKIVYISYDSDQSGVWLYNLETKEKKLITSKSQSDNQTLISWAASGKKVLLKLNDQYLIYDSQNNKQIPLPLPAENLDEIKNLKWDISSDSILYAQNQNNIIQIDLIAKNTKQILNNEESEILGFFIESNDIYYITVAETKNILYKFNQTFNTTKNVIELTKSSNYKFITSTNNYLTVIDEQFAKLYLIKKIQPEFGNELSNEQMIKEFSAKNAIWDIKEEQLLIYDDFEILTYNPGNGRETMINRYGQVIKKALWYPNLAYLMVSFEDHIDIIDLNLTNGLRNFIEIIKFDQIHNFSLDKKGNKLFLSGEIGKQKGLYQLEIQ